MRLRSETRDLLRAEAVAVESEKDEAIEALCDLFVILRSDKRYETSRMLRGDAMKVRRRLISIAERRAADLERAGVTRPRSLAVEVDAAVAAAVEAVESRSRQAEQQAAGGAALADPGWRLVELIQRIVAPDFWESRGGPGSIRYFAMRRVLVVRATTDVHEQIKDLLTALR